MSWDALGAEVAREFWQPCHWDRVEAGMYSYLRVRRARSPYKGREAYYRARYQAKKAAGIPTWYAPESPLTKAERAIVGRQRRSGKSVADLAKRLGRPESVIKNYIAAKGIDKKKGVMA